MKKEKSVLGRGLGSILGRSNNNPINSPDIRNLTQSDLISITHEIPINQIVLNLLRK